MSNSSFQSEIPKARINLKLDLHTGGASKKTELPLKLLVAGDFSNGQESAPLSERKKVNLNKNNFDSVLSEYSPKVNLTVKNTLAGDGNGFLVVLHLPEDLATRMPGTNAWHGKIAEQFGSDIPSQYLQGGGEQVIINLDEMLKKELNRIGEQVKATGQPASMEINGVKAEFYPSGWKDVEGVHGYSKPEGIDPPYATYTRELHDDELRSKVKDRTIINAARIVRQATTGSEQ
ncbi:type VI secretion system contractile sheath small subunit [Pantoea agglomerans]